MDLNHFDAQAGHDLGQDQRGIRGIDGKGDQPEAPNNVVVSTRSRALSCEDRLFWGSMMPHLQS